MNATARIPSPMVDAANLENALANAGNARIKRSAIPKALLVRPTVERLIRDAFVDWCVVILAWTLMVYTPAYLYPIWALIVAGRIHAFGVILHDACHMPPRKTWKHRLLVVISGYPLGITTDAMRYHHLRHHRDNGMPSDPYYKDNLDGSRMMYFLMWLRGIILIPFWLVGTVFGTVVSFLPAGGGRHWYGRIVLQDKSGKSLHTSDEVLRCAKAERGKLVVYGALITSAILVPWPYVDFILIPQLIVGLLSSYRLLVEHRYIPAPNRKIETIFGTTYDHNLGWFSQVFLAPRNIGFHIIHHIHPQVAWYALPKVRKWYIEQYPDQYPEAIGVWPRSIKQADNDIQATPNV